MHFTVETYMPTPLCSSSVRVEQTSMLQSPLSPTTSPTLTVDTPQDTRSSVHTQGAVSQVSTGYTGNAGSSLNSDINSTINNMTGSNLHHDHGLIDTMMEKSLRGSVISTGGCAKTIGQPNSQNSINALRRPFRDWAKRTSWDDGATDDPMWIFKAYSEDGNELLGSAHVQQNYLSKLMVYPAYRRQGVATRLIAYIEELLRQEGYHALYLTTITSYTAACHLYDKLGFSSIPEDILPAMIKPSPKTLYLMHRF